MSSHESQHLGEAARLNGDSPEVFFNRGCALQTLGRNEDALLCFARALALRADYVEARNNRGTTLLNLARHAEALRLEGAVASKLEIPAIGNGAIAMATVLAIPGDEGTIAPLRALADKSRGEVAASAWNGMIFS